MICKTRFSAVGLAGLLYLTSIGCSESDPKQAAPTASPTTQAQPTETAAPPLDEALAGKLSKQATAEIQFLLEKKREIGESYITLALERSKLASEFTDLGDRMTALLSKDQFTADDRKLLSLYKEREMLLNQKSEAFSEQGDLLGQMQQLIDNKIEDFKQRHPRSAEP